MWFSASCYSGVYSEVMFCSNCGAGTSDTGNYCQKCGAPLSRAALTQEQRSAIALPTIGVGFIRLPVKKTHLRVLRLRLILCDVCSRGQVAYTYHPWWNQAFRLGYTEFLTPDDLKSLDV
jgi:hypothetical protein